MSIRGGHDKEEDVEEGREYTYYERKRRGMSIPGRAINSRLQFLAETHMGNSELEPAVWSTNYRRRDYNERNVDRIEGETMAYDSVGHGAYGRE